VVRHGRCVPSNFNPVKYDDVMPVCTDCRRDFEGGSMKNGRAYKVCPVCRQQARARSAAQREAHPGANAQYLRNLRRRYRQEAFDAYGGKCACCGESRYEFLTIDHPNGGGRRERQLSFAPGGASFARWLARQGYPEGYRVLCHNCNSAYGYYGQCPHSYSR
jgi:hypothetical protein